MGKFFLYIIFFSLFICIDTYSQNTFGSYALPYPSIYYQEVTNKKDLALQLNLDKVIRANPVWKKLARQNRMSVAVVDLRQMNNIRYASVNGNNMVYAASLPKIAVLLSAMEAVDEGCLEYTPTLKKDLRLMIAKSNNAATTRVIEALGYDKIAATMTSEKYKLYDKYKGGGLWVGKKYAKAGHKKPDPLKGLSHAANVDQVARFYTMLAYGKLVNSEMNLEIMNYMIKPGINHKFVKTLKKIAPRADIYRKSGSWRQFHCDSALVFEGDDRRYIIVALIEDRRGGQICTNLVAKVEEALGMNAKPIIPILKKKRQQILKPGKL